MNSQISTPPSVDTTLKICAYCPNPCRRAWPAALAAPLESQLPSSLALLALAVLDSRIECDDQIMQALQPAEGTKACVTACSYGLNVLGAVSAAISGRRAR